MPKTFRAVVNYDISLQGMILAGEYDHVDPRITDSNFSLQQPCGEGMFEHNFELLAFDRKLGALEMVADMSKRGYRPAVIEELLAFGARYPEVQRTLRIIALGSWLGQKFEKATDWAVPELSFWKQSPGVVSRRLLLRHIDHDDWSWETFRFLAVRKEN